MLLTLSLCIKPFSGLTQCTSFITSFPYNEDFENNNGGWVTGQSGTVLSDWAWGHPNKTYINNAGSGNKCWITGGLSGNAYNDTVLSWLKTPCFNFSALQKPMISFKVFWETEIRFDGVVLQYSTNAGSTWSNVGAVNEPANCVNKNWYNTASVQWLKPPLVTVNNGWSGSHVQTGTCASNSGSLGWVTAAHSLDFIAGASSVVFRFVFGSGAICNNFNGFALDSVYIGEAPNLPLPLFPIVNPVCQGDPAPLLPSTSTNGVNGTWNSLVSTTIPGTKTYTFTPSSGQCFSSVTKDIVVNPKVTPTFAAVAAICKGTALASLPTTSTNSITGSWSPALNDTITTTYTFTPDLGQCSSSTTLTITVNSLPLNVSAGPSLSTVAGVGVMLQGSAPTVSPAMTYQWTPSAGLSNATILNPIASPTQNTTYTLQVTNSFGCKTTAATTVTIIPVENCSIEPSRIFTPNNDGYYDSWMVYNGNCIKSVDASVYNRWGGLVYHSDRYQNDWNGNYKSKPLPDATYYYVLRITENTGKTYLLKGNVTIKR